MKISVFGSGYVGLVQAAVLAEVGHDVLCMDIDEDKIAKLKRGQISIFEPGLAELVRDNLEAGRLRFTSDVAETAAHGRVQFIAVGTPPLPDGSADLRAVLAVAEGIARHRTQPVIVVEKSTVPVGTGDRLRAKVHRAVLWKPRKAAAWTSRSSPTPNSSRKARRWPTAATPTASWSAAKATRCWT